MIHLTAGTKIHLAIKPADFRCGIDGLAAVCRQQLRQDPADGKLFVFINRSKTMIRVLVYDGSGFWLMTKRLSKGKFTGWPQKNQALSMIAATELKILLSGNDPSLFQQVS